MINQNLPLTIPVQTLKVKSLDELVNLFRQGYTIDQSTPIRQVGNDSVVRIKSAGLLVDVTVIGIISFVISITIAALFYFRYGRYINKKLGWN